MEVEQRDEAISATGIVTALLNDFSAVTDHRTLRDTLPRRLTSLLKCRSVLLYQRIGEKLHFVSGSFDERPGWSSSLLAVAHINPIGLSSDVPEACAWRERRAIATPLAHPTHLALPLLCRHRSIGVLVVLRGTEAETSDSSDYWRQDEVHMLEALAGVVALLLENTRLLERDRERIQELALLNSISSQMNSAMYEQERLRSIVVQRTREISTADLCAFIEPTAPPDTIAWLPPSLWVSLTQHMLEQQSPAPLIFERPGDPTQQSDHDYLHHLPATIKTFFALPLFSNRTPNKYSSSLLRGSLGTSREASQESQLLGIIVGAYHRAWKLRHEEIVLLQILANQACVVLENMRLISEVVEARNEARKLLRQVLDDQLVKELILESIPSGLITTDQQGRIVTFNRAAEAILGYHPYEVIGQPLHKCIDVRPVLLSERTSSLPSSSGLHEQAQTFYDMINAVSVQGGTLVTRDRQGHEMILDIDLLPLRNNHGEQIGMLATFTDVTSLHRLEEERRRLDRLASLGEMAANVAHEVRNPLASIKTSMQMLMDDLASPAPPPATSPSLEVETDWAQESITVVLKEVERLDRIVGDLLLFAKPRQLHRVKCDLRELCDRVLQFIQPQCSETNVMIHRIYGDLPPIWVDRGQIEQVLLNLSINALQAMPDGGILTVACHRISADGAFPQEEAETAKSTANKRVASSPHADQRAASPQQWQEIVVSDTGTGMTPEQLERIFQPFFTTKAHGIGLGLAITRRLVEDHNGYIHVESQFGYGASISVRLPLLMGREEVHREEIPVGS